VPRQEEKANRDPIQSLTMYSFNVPQCQRRMDWQCAESKCRLAVVNVRDHPRLCGSGFNLGLLPERFRFDARRRPPNISARPSASRSGRLVSFPVIFFTTPLNSVLRRAGRRDFITCLIRRYCPLTLTSASTFLPTPFSSAQCALRFADVLFEKTLSLHASVARDASSFLFDFAARSPGGALHSIFRRLSHTPSLRTLCRQPSTNDEMSEKRPCQGVCQIERCRSSIYRCKCCQISADFIRMLMKNRPNSP
jgi:hypothetical protein